MRSMDQAGAILMLYYCWCVISHKQVRFRKGKLNDTNIVNGVVIFLYQRISVDEKLGYRVLNICSHLKGLTKTRNTY